MAFALAVAHMLGDVLETGSHEPGNKLVRSPARRPWVRWSGQENVGVETEELMGRVHALRKSGCSPKEIARALDLPPARVAPLVRTAAAAEQATATEREIVGCWISPGWSGGLTVEGHPEWPDVDAADSDALGLVSVLVAREEARGRVGVCGYLVDVYCLGVKDVIGPRVMDRHAVRDFAHDFFHAYQAQPLAAPVDLARHLVFGAAEYARSLGFTPAPDFDTTAAYLGLWDGPSAIGFGHNGKPFFVQGPRDNATEILETLERSAGWDNFHFLVSVY
jgi:hypothetical protein